MDVSESSYNQFKMASKLNQEPNYELSRQQLILLDKMNLQNIISNKNMAHAVTALDLLRAEGFDMRHFENLNYDQIAPTAFDDNSAFINMFNQNETGTISPVRLN